MSEYYNFQRDENNPKNYVTTVFSNLTETIPLQISKLLINDADFALKHVYDPVANNTCEQYTFTEENQVSLQTKKDRTENLLLRVAHHNELDDNYQVNNEMNNRREIILPTTCYDGRKSQSTFYFNFIFIIWQK